MRSMTEQQAVVKSMEERQSSSSPSSSSATLMWPSIGGMPINEFTTEGYFTCAFPTLFPTGVADFSGLGRQNQVTIFNKHITTMQPDQCLPVCIIIHLYTFIMVRFNIYSMVQSGPFYVAHYKQEIPCNHSLPSPAEYYLDNALLS